MVRIDGGGPDEAASRIVSQHLVGQSAHLGTADRRVRSIRPQFSINKNDRSTGREREARVRSTQPAGA